MKIGIYGGSFNPVHNGHLKVAEWILDRVKLDKIIWVPLYKPYHKEISDLEDSEHRYNMLRLALGKKKKYEISRVEIDAKIISYTLDTLLALKKQYPGNEFYEIIGGDSAETFHTWKDYKEILENANRRSLVLIDELGSGTDPMEGSAFAMAVIDYLNQKNIKSIITTHYSEVKAHAFNTNGIKSASMEFNVETLLPTYRLLEGIPGESNALIIAGKYGINEEIINNAKSYISEENQKVEKMLISIKEKTDEVEKLKIELENAKEEMESRKQKYEADIITLENEKNQIVKEAYDEADKYLREVQAKAKNLVDKISQDEMKKEEAKDAQRSLNMLRESFRLEKEQNVKKKVKTNKKTDFQLGEEVFVKSINQNGKILRIIGESDSVQIQAGILKLVVSTDDIQKIEKKNKKKLGGFASLKSTNVKGEVDLRGMTGDEAMTELELYLDRAMLTGYSEVFIIHGKGTMALRTRIQEYLKKSKYISEYRDANQNEGGLGCTVAKLK